MNRIAVAIPYFREREKLDRCLAALAAQTRPPDATFVRDNSEDNILFTAAVNEGLRKYAFDPDFEFTLVVNQDCYLHAEALAELVACMGRNPRCGVACPIQLGVDGAVTWGGSLEAFPFGRHRRDPLETYTEDFATSWANGACMLIRSALVREIGLLDENMRFLCSDSDYSFTARARGWSVMVAARARVDHAPGASRGERDDWINRVKLEDTLYFANKWLTGGVYRNLAYEGDRISPLAVRMAVGDMETQLKTGNRITVAVTQ